MMNFIVWANGRVKMNNKSGNRRISGWRGYVVILLACFILVVAYAVLNMHHSAGKEDVKAEFDASLDEREEEKREGGRYDVSESADEFDRQIASDAVSGDVCEYRENVNKVVAAMQAEDDSSVYKMLNKKALKERGYGLCDGAIEMIKAGYRQECGGDGYVIQPYRYVDGEDYGFVFCRICRPCRTEGGECYFDYARAVFAVYTVYDDGTFLPFSVKTVTSQQTGVYCLEGAYSYVK